MIRLFLPALLLLHYSMGMAQFNDTTHYHFRFASTGVINKANDISSYVLKNAFDFNTQQKIVNYNTAFSWIYGAQQKSLTNNDFMGHADVDFNKRHRKLYYWGLINFDKSYSLKINYRLQTGAGFAYNIIDSPYLKINISDGFLYEKGDLTDARLGQDVYQIPRNSFRLSYRWDLHNRIHIDGTHFYQPSLLAFNDYIIQSASNISIKVKQWLSINASLIYNSVSRTKRENLLITYGVGFEKYF